MKKLILLALLTTSCATGMKEYKAKGYTDEDMALMKPYVREYSSRISSSIAFGGAFSNIKTEDTLKTVFCNCYKKHGDLCRKPSSELGDKDKTLWAKSNAAELALKSQLFGSGPTLDNDECEI